MARAFVGRADELRWVEAVCADVAGAGRGRLVTVTGEAGIGKTRFCEECATRAGAAGLTVVWGRCWADGGAPPLWPWQSILAGLGGAGAAALLDGDAGRDAVDPERFARFVAVGERLAAACAGSPVCLVLDDLHAADPGALLLTRFVASLLDRLPLVLLVTRRPAGPGLDPVAARLLDQLETAGTLLVLRGFDLQETGSLVSAWGGDLDADLLSAVQRVTRGSPLVLRRLLDRGAPLSAQTLPNGLQAAVADEVRRLGPAAARVLERSAVLAPSVSISEAAALAGASRAQVLDVLAQARRAGLVDEEGPSSFAFSHELVREALAARLSAADRLDAHAAAAALLAGTDPDGVQGRLARRAHHAVQAAARGPADALGAVAACRDAARFMIRRFAYERAASLLATAVALSEEAAAGPVPASLHLERAQATLLCGRLAEARALFDVAARAAEREDEQVLLAQAAIGLGGVWANEHRDPVERERVLALQRRALAGLPEAEAVLRGRLRVRLAAEAVFQGGPIEAVFQAVREVRRLGDGRALAEALSLLHHAMLAAEFTDLCLAIADELIAVASAAGEGVLALMGLCLRAADLFQLGDPGAVRALSDLRARADAVGSQSILYVVGVLDVMQLLRAGRLDDAEELAARCHQLGIEVGDADALAYYGAHLVAIRWLQGREAEVLDVVEEVAASPTLALGQFVYPATVAFLAARAGQYDRARLALHRVAAPGLAALPRSSTWLTGLAAIADAAATLGDRAVASQAYEQLRLFAGRPIMPSLAIVCFGSVERPLGLAALALGDVDAGVRHLERAVEADVRLGNRPVAACSRAELAEALLRRGVPADAPRAGQLLEEAVREAGAMGMTRRAEAWTAMLGRAAAGSAARTDVVRREGRHWRVEVSGRSLLVEDLVGLAYVARLMETPGRPVPALSLVSGGEPPAAEPLSQPVLDEEARAAYAARVRELAAEVDEARANADIGRSERLQAELDVLTSELAAATGLRGRRRTFAGPEERARTAVRKAITRALDVIAATDADVAAVLRARIRTGYRCRYVPDVPD
ncbi:MAG TPA: ATP-binding protein [Candidatus Dormibacteraeota bacterium]|nr:ATP-binding protein [Candidatus Dormibacteraeota bacterium]